MSAPFFWRAAKPARVVLAVSLTTASMSVIGPAAPAVAECSTRPWPSFERAVRDADQVLVGEVTDEIRRNSADFLTAFRFRVDEVLRGTGPDEIAFEWAIIQRRDLCPTSLPVHVGDRLALALEDPVNGHPSRSVVGVPAFLNRDPSEGDRAERDFTRGLRQMTLDEVRDLLALPPTDTETSAQPAARDLGWVTDVLRFLLRPTP